LDADSAFAFFEPAIIYLLESEEHQAYKLGISNTVSYKIRKSQHRMSGFKTVLREVETEYGYEANYVEQFVLTDMRETDGIAEGVDNSLMPGKGGTETWLKDALPFEEVWRRVMEQLELRRWPIPRAVLEGDLKKKVRRGCPVVEKGSPCLNPYYSKGYCHLHYSRWRIHGDPLRLVRIPFRNEFCQVFEDGMVCGKVAVRSEQKSDVGMCQTHYLRNYEYGSPTFMKRPAPKKRTGVCSVDGCKKEDHSLNFCKLHYHEDRRIRRRAREGRAEPVKYDSDICSIDGCERRRSVLGLCSRHYGRQRAHGSPHNAGRGPITEKLGKCRVLECKKPDDQKGLCAQHYSREYKRKRRGTSSLLD